MLHNLSFQTLPADLRDYIGDRYEEQRLELINKANEVNTKISEFFNELEKSSQSA